MFMRRGRTMPSSRRVLLVLPLWYMSSIWMWGWWFSIQQINIGYLYVLLSMAMLYEFFVLPTLFLYFSLRAKTPARRIAQKGLKVAVISPCVPAQESIEIVERQLAAMSAITYPHDSWLLDEGGSKELKQATCQKIRCQIL